MNHKLFRSIKYWIPECVPEPRRTELAQAIGGNGGERADSMQSATHIITNSNRFQGWQDVLDTVQIVSDLWVDRTMVLGQLLPCEFYSAHPGKLFSGVVACPAGISASDLPELKIGMATLGGQWRDGFTSDVTHLFATSADSDKYALAMKFQETSHMIVLLPHWFDDCVRHARKLPTAPYEWPDPKVLRPLPSEEEGKIEKAEKSARKLTNTKRALYKTANWDPATGDQFPGPQEPVADDIWGGRKILLSHSLALEEDRRHVLEEAIEAAGGLILYYAWDNEQDQEDEEFERVSECDIFITRWRARKPFFQAFDDGKIIGTLNWVFYVHATGVLSSPMDQLLHYPVRKIPVGDKFSDHKITVTNYTGESRDYLKRLIHIMGATFTPNMTGSNTVLIAAHMGGIKTAKAVSWNIPVVNHIWLEDCFLNWRNTTPAIQKYIDFPRNLDFAPMLGETRLNLTRDDLANEEDDDLAVRAQPPSERPPVGTEASAKEVERILGDGDIMMNDYEGEECPVPGSGKRMVPASVSPTKHRSSDEDMDVDPVPKAFKSLKRPETQPTPGDVPTPAPKRGKQPDDDETDSPSNGARKTSQRKGKERAVDLEEEMVTPGNGKGKGKEKEKPRKTANKVMFAPETETNAAGPSNPHVFAKNNTSASKRKAQLMESASNDEAEVDKAESPPLKKRAKSGKSRGSASTSDLVDAQPSGKRKMTAGPGRDSSLRKIPRTESLHALADERVKGAKPPPKKAGQSAPVASSSKSHRSSAGTTKTPRVELEEEEDQVMPDVVNLEKGRTQRSRVSSGKNRDDVDSADEMPPPKVTKPKAKTGKKAAPNASPTRASPRSTIKLMTTSTTLPDAVTKALAKLGAKTTTQISECTHLIAPSLVRTEKLLCALAGGAFILSDKWAIKSVEAKKLLPEEDYFLNDDKTERKWNFRLPEAMARAKEVGGKLFENKTFYLTPKVPVESKLLKNVVTSQGGKLLTQTPTVRIINSVPGRYVISCPEDIAIWRPIAPHIEPPIYTQELLLAASMTQKIDWDNPAFQVPKSN